MFKPADYFITPGDIARAFRWRYLIGATVGICVLVGMHKVGIGWDVALFASAVVATIIWKMDARIPFGAAILCFIAIMLASVMAPDTPNSQGSLREQLAVSAFYCLVIGVALLIREQIIPRSRLNMANDSQATYHPHESGSPVPAAVPAPRQVAITESPAQIQQPAILRPAVVSHPSSPPQRHVAPTHAGTSRPLAHLAPHPMLHKAPARPTPTHPPNGRHIIRDIIRVPQQRAYHTQPLSSQRSRGKLVQL